MNGDTKKNATKRFEGLIKSFTISFLYPYLILLLATLFGYFSLLFLGVLPYPRYNDMLFHMGGIAFSWVCILLFLAIDVIKEKESDKIKIDGLYSFCRYLIEFKKGLLLVVIIMISGIAFSTYHIFRTVLPIERVGSTGIVINYPGFQTNRLVINPQESWQNTNIEIQEGDKFSVEVYGSVSPGVLQGIVSRDGYFNEEKRIVEAFELELKKLLEGTNLAQSGETKKALKKMILTLPEIRGHINLHNLLTLKKMWKDEQVGSMQKILEKNFPYLSNITGNNLANIKLLKNAVLEIYNNEGIDKQLNNLQQLRDRYNIDDAEGPGIQLKWPFTGPEGYDAENYAEVIKSGGIRKWYNYRIDSGMIVEGQQHNKVIGIIAGRDFNNEKKRWLVDSDEQTYKGLFNFSSKKYPLKFRALNSGFLWVVINDSEGYRWDNGGFFILSVKRKRF